LSGDPALLATLAEAMGGRALELADTASTFEHNLDAAPAAQPIWPWLTLAAVLLLPLDVAARRLTLTRGDWARAWRRVTGYKLRTTSEEKPEDVRAEGMAQLMRAKERARPVAQAVELAEERGSAGEMPDAAEQPPTADGQQTADRRPPSADQSSPDDTLTARLRKRRGL
jgi:hypothetical protein